ncbi:MAG: efflux transporter outer membrane subunit [Erythrobacter sp.]|uniref:efflux transporter outer membrane subunit n=1 Tax=Erythrobacter sp. TaxID=1042 RepID=UPI00260C4DA2|nr:efflux transporter outer membrane subunit [Erythrobacter sp.]MDJ0978668.1 efflux transporter outer membrane subunit [Erythrobacter sp.]
MRWSTLLGIAAAALSLSACTIVGRDYDRPELGLPDRSAVTLTPSEAQTAANVPWFDVFDDPELRPLIEEALASNLDLQLAFARIEEARARLLVSRSLFFPRVDGALTTAATPQSNSNDGAFTLGLLLNWEVDLFGKIRRQNEAARAQLLASEAGKNAVVTSIVQQTAATWLTLRELQAEESIIARNIELQEEALELVLKLNGQGIVSDSEVQQATAQLAGTRALLPQTVQTRLVTENLLTVLLGRYPSEIDLTPFDPVRQAQGIGAYALPVGVPSDLLARRPDVIFAEQELVAATANEGVAIANRFPFPTIGLTGLLGRTSTDIGSLFEGGRSSALNSWGPNVQLPILNFGRDLGNVRVAEAQTRQALIVYRQTIQTALFEVNSAVYAYTAAEEQLDPLTVQLTAAQRTLFLQDLRFRSGVVSYLSVLDAQRLVLSTELAIARARLQRDLAFTDLYRALGGGWDGPEAAL